NRAFRASFSSLYRFAGAPHPRGRPVDWAAPPYALPACRALRRRGASPGKGAGEEADGWYAPRFGHNRVVETPRRTGPLISNPVDDGITFPHQRVKRLRGAGGVVSALRPLASGRSS